MRIMLGLATICALAFVMPTAAHHSHGNYTDGTMDIEGSVVLELYDYGKALELELPPADQVADAATLKPPR